jgi:hypothetical protein
VVTRASVVVAALLAAACGDAQAPSGAKAEVELPAKRDAPAKADATNQREAIAQADTKAEKVESPDAPTPPDGADPKADAPSDAGGAIGVPACDAYITKYSKCIETGVPADIRDLMKEAIEHSREAWKKAAGGSEKGDLPSICKGALAAAKQATAKYGCVW